MNFTAIDSDSDSVSRSISARLDQECEGHIKWNLRESDGPELDAGPELEADTLESRVSEVGALPYSNSTTELQRTSFLLTSTANIIDPDLEALTTTFLLSASEPFGSGFGISNSWASDKDDGDETETDHILERNIVASCVGILEPDRLFDLRRILGGLEADELLDSLNVVSQIATQLDYPLPNAAGGEFDFIRLKSFMKNFYVSVARMIATATPGVGETLELPYQYNASLMDRQENLGNSSAHSTAAQSPRSENDMSAILSDESADPQGSLGKWRLRRAFNVDTNERDGDCQLFNAVEVYEKLMNYEFTQVSDKVRAAVQFLLGYDMLLGVAERVPQLPSQTRW